MNKDGEFLMTIYGFVSMINHGKPNIKHSRIKPYLNISRKNIYTEIYPQITFRYDFECCSICKEELFIFDYIDLPY